jgi:hypothetical protein
MQKRRGDGMRVALVLALWLAAVAQASEWRVLPTEGKAEWDATHVATLSYSDLTTSATNTAQAITNVITVPADTGIECVGCRLVKAFDTGSAFTGSLALEVGTDADADLFLTSTELASDGTEVFAKYGRADIDTITLTRATLWSVIVTNVAANTLTVPIVTNITYTLNAIGGGGSNVVTAVTALTNSLAVMTNVTTVAASLVNAVTNAALSSSGGTYGKFVTGAATNLAFTFTPNAEEAVSANTKGKVEVYFRLFRP